MRQIICGFAGIGKSHCAKNSEGVVDLESTPFKKNWDFYADVAEHMGKNGYYVLTACHKEWRDKLKERGIEYAVVIPHKEMKQEYMRRYKDRGNTPEFIKMIDENFEKFIEEIEKSESHIIYIQEYLTL